MSLDLRVAIDNAHDTLTTVVPAYATGRYLQPNLPHAIGIYFRQLGTCRMLLEGVAAPVFQAQMQAALLRTAAAREANLDKLIERGSLTQELALWMKPVWPEGLALLRLAERDGLSTAFPCPGVPDILRIPPPLTYDSNAWRAVMWTPPRIRRARK
jgi:hypothetical protein